jgi:hypothetical protein
MLSKRQRQRHPGDKVDLENDGSTRSTDWQEACPLARMRHGLVGHVALNKGMQTTGDNNIDGNPGSYLSLLSIESLLVMQPRQLVMRNYGRLIEALSQALLKISPSWLRLSN